MASCVLVLLDGLNATTARLCMGFMVALEQAGKIRHTELHCEMPPLSRPLYATLFSGKTPAEHGILHNEDTRLCPSPTIFSRARDAGLVTAAAAWYWVSELCNATPFIPARDRLTHSPSLPIGHGLFYSSDTYPDTELFRDAESLRYSHAPHLLLVHSMGIDTAGHRHGSDSRAYRDAAREADGLLARTLPAWIAAGYTVIVTADHGMNADGSHNDITDNVRLVPLWLTGHEEVHLPTAQTQIAGLVDRLLNLD
ncbi:MAG: alkaline phosphatase family protein [Desulfovibrio sp.]|nr:alkaline phosphatase family protein [Desulfovibrio sp.]